MPTNPILMWAARETCYMHVRREEASASGTPFPQRCEAETQQPFCKKQLEPPKEANQETTAAAEATATHGLLTRRQLPPQFVHNAICPNSHGWPRPSDAA